MARPPRLLEIGVLIFTIFSLSSLYYKNKQNQVPIFEVPGSGKKDEADFGNEVLTACIEAVLNSTLGLQ